VDLAEGTWLEPAAGDGAIIRASGHEDWYAIEVRSETRSALSEIVGPDRVIIGDYLEVEGPKADQISVVFSNPPFSLAWDMIQHSLAKYHRSQVVMLERLNFISSAKRGQILRWQMPDVYVLPNRPTFGGARKYDSCEYGWFVWPSTEQRDCGRIQILAETSREERARDTRQLELIR